MIFLKKQTFEKIAAFYSAKREENRMRRLFSGGAAEKGRALHDFLP